jgi:(p)ppGpp synthase/HD superfamily hydrolase
MWSREARQEVREYVNQQEKRDELLKEYRILNDLINDYDLTNVTVDKQQKYIKKLESEL